MIIHIPKYHTLCPHVEQQLDFLHLLRTERYVDRPTRIQVDLTVGGAFVHAGGSAPSQFYRRCNLVLQQWSAGAANEWADLKCRLRHLHVQVNIALCRAGVLEFVYAHTSSGTDIFRTV